MGRENINQTVDIRCRPQTSYVQILPVSMSSATLFLLVAVVTVTTALAAKATGHPPPCDDDEMVPDCQPCIHSCSDQATECTKDCKKNTGCYCKPGFLWAEEGEKCVPMAECPKKAAKRSPPQPQPEAMMPRDGGRSM